MSAPTRREIVDVLKDCIQTEKNSHREIVDFKWKLVDKAVLRRIKCLETAIRVVKDAL